MWFVVSDTLVRPFETWPVKVNEDAAFDLGAKELTVTLPAAATTTNGVPFGSFFILGIENKGQ